MPKVIVIKEKEVLFPDGSVNKKKLVEMYRLGFSILTGQKKIKDSIYFLFNEGEKIGIKINTIGGKKLSTRPEVSLCLANELTRSNIQGKNILIWDRTNRELKDAGYRLNMSRNDIQVYGTDTKGVGYNNSIVSHLNIGSLLSSIQSDIIDFSISLAILKDHGLAGVTAGIKNYFGAIHNPNKYHDSNCNPYIAEVFDIPSIRKKHRLSILDCLMIQYNYGPSFHSRWIEKYESLVFSMDPVAADCIGWNIIEKIRAKKGLPSLSEEKREPFYLKTAEKMGLGEANINNIELLEEEV